MSRGCEEGVKSCQEGVKSCQESAKWTPSTCQEGVKRVSRECQGHAKRVSPRCQEGAKKVSQKAEALAAAAASGPGRLGQSDSDIEANFNRQEGARLVCLRHCHGPVAWIGSTAQLKL